MLVCPEARVAIPGKEDCNGIERPRRVRVERGIYRQPNGKYARLGSKVGAGERHPRTLEAHDVAELLHQLRRSGRSAKTAASPLATLQSVMRFARRCTGSSPTRSSGSSTTSAPGHGRRRQRVLGRAELERPLAACAPRDQLMVATVLDTGQRISEMLGLVWDGSSFGTAVAGTILVSDLASGNTSYVLAMVALGALALSGSPPRSACRPTHPTQPWS